MGVSGSLDGSTTSVSEDFTLPDLESDEGLNGFNHELLNGK